MRMRQILKNYYCYYILYIVSTKSIAALTVIPIETVVCNVYRGRRQTGVMPLPIWYVWFGPTQVRNVSDGNVTSNPVSNRSL